MTEKTAKKIRVTLLASPFGKLKMHRANLHGLGLRRIRQTVERAATPEIMGMVRKSSHMLKVEEV